MYIKHLIVEYYIQCEAIYKMPSRLAPGMHGDYQVPGRYREKNIIF